MAIGRILENVQVGTAGANVLTWQWPKLSASGQIDPYCEDEESKSISISMDLDVLDPVPLVTDTTESAFWIVRWSSGNLTQVAEIDCQLGTFITVVGSEVSVNISYPDIRGLSGPGTITQPPLTVRAVLGFDGGRQSPGLTSVARRTVLVQFLAFPAAAVSAVFPIPRQAVAAVIRNDTPTATPMTFNQFGNNAGGQLVSSAFIGKLDSQSVPVANGARFFSLANTSGVGCFHVSVVFYLAL